LKLSFNLVINRRYHEQLKPFCMNNSSEKKRNRMPLIKQGFKVDMMNQYKIIEEG